MRIPKKHKTIKSPKNNIILLCNRTWYHISKTPFMFFNRHGFHIHDFGDFIKRFVGICRCLSFPKLTKCWKSRYANQYVLKMFGICYCIFGNVFVNIEGSEGPDSVNMFEVPRNGPKILQYFRESKLAIWE